jgi:hypothetical protein
MTREKFEELLDDLEGCGYDIGAHKYDICYVRGRALELEATIKQELLAEFDRLTNLTGETYYDV